MSLASGYLFLLFAIILGISSNGFLKATDSFTNIYQLDIRDNCIDEIEPEFLARLTQCNARNLYLQGNMVSYSASKIRKYKSLLPYAYISS